jgi:hypothetical protein
MIDPEAHARFIEEQRRIQTALDEKTDEEIKKYRKQVVQRRTDYEQAAHDALAIDAPDDAIEKLAAERNLVVQVLRRAVDSIQSDAATNDASNVDPFELSSDDVRRWARVQIQEATAKLRNQLAELEIQHPGAPVRAMVLVDKAEPVNPVVFVRGNPGNRGPEVPRQLPGVLAGERPEPFTIGSGRLELARAIASPDNPLTARVIVNRIWLGHFGQGLVRTPSDFGVRTVAPPHRALLDYLACWLVENGWSLKQLHRLILLSNTYAQATDDNPEYAAQDPGNDLLWKMNRRRLDFEALRDTLLVAGGNLDLSIGGRAVDIASNDPAPRRTVYGFIDRQNLPGLFRTFDFANPDVTSPQRFATTVPQQALYLMNNPFAIRQARRLMERPELTSVADAARVQRLYRLLYQRDPDAEELRLARAFLESQSDETTTVVPGPAWKYGFGSYDPAQDRITTFTQFDHFQSNRWQPGAEYPAPEFGHAALNASGGHPGPDGSLSVIRRWVAPLGGTIAIEGELEHKNEQGDGVRGLIVHGMEGELGRWDVFNNSATTGVDRVRVEAGDVVDFVTDPRETASYDSFNWAPRIRFLDVDPMETLQASWDANADFVGPGKGSPAPLDPWERYAHVLLQSNELVFLD